MSKLAKYDLIMMILLDKHGFSTVLNPALAADAGLL